MCVCVSVSVGAHPVYLQICVLLLRRAYTWWWWCVYVCERGQRAVPDHTPISVFGGLYMHVCNIYCDLQHLLLVFVARSSYPRVFNFISIQYYSFVLPVLY